ncbi:MAG: SDR family oxidoreductase [Bryobacteraceae bacterium]|nr:SDR family oxidoreductase [Bryobacteraceae bacterium]
MREVVIAGGSGGLGSAAVRLLSTDCRVVFSYRTNAVSPADAATPVQADLLSASDRARLLDAAPALYGLAVFTGTPARGDSEEAYRLSHDVNYLGPILLAREAASRMRATSTPGAIVLISTMQASAVFPNSTAYAAQKAALIHAGLILAKENRGRTNIRVNIVCPGVNQAGMAEASIAAGKYRRYLDEDIIPRYGYPADVARAVRFLLEPDNYITGQVISVDGGLTL